MDYWCAQSAMSNRSQREGRLKQYIMRFGGGNKRMAKQAKSRMKMLERLQDEPCEVVDTRRITHCSS